MRWSSAGAAATVPAARCDRLIVTEAGDETLVYDTEMHHIHRLNATTAAVWRLCDGRRAVGDLARETGQALGASVGEASVRLALTKLDDAGLLQAPLSERLRVSRMSRRTLMQRVGVAGAVAIPAIVSVTMPAAAHHSAGDSCGHPCQLQRNCSVGCRVCNHQVCLPHQCDMPCEISDTCGYALQGECTVCIGPDGAKTCQKPTAGVTTDSSSSLRIESADATEPNLLPALPLDGAVPYERAAGESLDTGADETIEDVAPPPPGGTPVVGDHGG